MMRRTLALLLGLGIGSTALASDTRTLTGSVKARGLDSVVLNASIGDIDLEGVDDAADVTIEVLLTPRRGGLFSSKRRAEEEVRQAFLSAETRGGRLELSVEPQPDGDRRFEEDWRIKLPADLAVEIEHGVGDIVITRTRAALEIDSGVGDVRLEARGGDISVDLGVGTALVSAPAELYGEVEAAGGVGDARLTVAGEKIDEGGFIGSSASWKGRGSLRMEVSVGVGDAVINLD